MTICPDAQNAQNIVGTASAQGSTACVLMRRRNPSFKRLIAFVVQADFHCEGSSQVNVSNRSSASSKLLATARHLRHHSHRNALRRFSIFAWWRALISADRGQRFHGKTGTLSFSEWATVFGDAKMTTASPTAAIFWRPERTASASWQVRPPRPGK